MTKRIFQAVGIMLLSATALMAGSAQRWIHVRVESANGGNNNVSINVPIQMATRFCPRFPPANTTRAILIWRPR